MRETRRGRRPTLNFKSQCHFQDDMLLKVDFSWHWLFLIHKNTITISISTLYDPWRGEGLKPPSEFLPSRI